METPGRKKQNDDCVTPQMRMDLRKELQQAINRRNNLTTRSKLKAIKFLETSIEEENDATDFDRRNQLRRKAIEEILSSEKSYLNQLEKLMTFFVNPLKNLNLIEMSSQSQLFGQLELIYNINQELLMRLENDLDDVANAFLKLAPFFKIYSVFAFDYRNSMILLQNLTTKNTPFRNFLEKTESRPEVQQKLNSLLIAPIQRVPRYRLLLQQVLLYTSPADSDYKLIQESIKQIESTINHINSVVEDQENTQTMLNIQNSLMNRIPHIVRPSRRFIKEGMLFKYSANGTMLKRYCVLCSDIFMYCKVLKDRKPDTAVENSLDCCCIFPLKKCKVVEIFAGKFKLTCMSEGIILCSEDVQTGRGWIKALKDTIDMHIETRKTIRKDSSKRKPMRKKEIKKFEKLEAELMSPNEKKSHYDKIFYGANVSSTDIEVDNEQRDNSCFHSRRLRKRRHSEMENEDTRSNHKSIFATIKEKFGFGDNRDNKKSAKSILSSVNGEHNLSYQHNEKGDMSCDSNHSFTDNTNKQHIEEEEEEESDDDGGFKDIEHNISTTEGCHIHATATDAEKE
ncbi:hypothetical protein PVAND_008985 [Polypedilum vanderplanki]|uniref:Uncharacterized protein n=1 Tax=Polypedilum vanderplanki TaxID=319348 RepID=A0A9J6CBI2_POLVA|nr:hypothetical protein PVAND_008985 [Polypedilum vanderplanki]